MVALAAWLLLLVLLGACGGCARLGDGIHAMQVDTTLHPEQEALALYGAGRFTEAEVYAREALERAEDPHFAEGSTLDFLARGLSLGSPGLAASLNTLALVYLGQGRYAEAEPLLERALAIREQGLGLDHPDPATILNNLAMAYQGQGRYAEAEPLLKRALAIQEQALGPDDPEVGTILNNLAIVYASEGRYAEAEQLYQRALAIRDETLGSDHPELPRGVSTTWPWFTRARAATPRPSCSVSARWLCARGYSARITPMSVAASTIWL